MPPLRVRPPAHAGDDPIRGSALGHQPELVDAFLKLYGILWSRGVLDHPAKEMARLRNARITDCGY
jgi:alkylhydroperoxidase family enzyme